jgi:hypothetical protein
MLALERLGWRAPEFEEQNWFRTFSPTSPDDYDEIVRLVHRAFQTVYGVGDDVPLTMTTAWEEHGETAVPGLLDRTQPETSPQETASAEDADLAATLDGYDFCRTPTVALGRRLDLPRFP